MEGVELRSGRQDVGLALRVGLFRQDMQHEDSP